MEHKSEDSEVGHTRLGRMIAI